MFFYAHVGKLPHFYTNLILFLSVCFQTVQDLNYFIGDTDLERSTPTLQTSILSLFQVSLKSYPFAL